MSGIFLSLTLIVASPHTLPDVIFRARSGDIVRLNPGDYGSVSIKRRQWQRPITILAGQARMSLSIVGSSGINVNSGIFQARDDIVGYAVNVSDSDNVSFENSRFQSSRKGLVISKSRHVRVERSTFSGMTVDGINVASSQNVYIGRNSCLDFLPMLRAHPDCVQLWSRPGMITSDVAVVDNISTGDMQGFTAFNHVRAGIDDGGFDRVEMTGNIVVGSAPQGVAVYDCRDCNVSNNRTRRLPGARWKVSVNVVRCSRCVVDNNTVES